MPEAATPCNLSLVDGGNKHGRTLLGLQALPIGAFDLLFIDVREQYPAKLTAAARHKTSARQMRCRAFSGHGRQANGKSLRGERERERRSFLACAAPLVSASHELVSLCKVHVPPMTEALITVQNSLPHLVSWNYLSGLLTFSLANSV